MGRYMQITGLGLLLFASAAWADMADVEGRWLTQNKEGWIRLEIVGDTLEGSIAGAPPGSPGKRDFDDRKLAAAARVAQNWGWYEQSIQTLIDSDRWDDLRVRFPLAFHDTFLAHARELDIPVNWTLAIARQESAFMPDAKSSSGALGVMQLMPATAQHTADRYGIPYRGSEQLIDPLTNISLGTAYLGEMFRRFGGNRILASAAYNAGPLRVERWIEGRDVDLDVWIETIPFRETRGYVQNILFFSVIFAYRLDQPQQLIDPREREQFARRQFSQREPTGGDRSS